MDNVLQTEVLLNMLNTIFAKAVYLKNDTLIKKLSELRHDIYYTDFDYQKFLEILKGVEEDLKKYE